MNHILFIGRFRRIGCMKSIFPIIIIFTLFISLTYISPHPRKNLSRISYYVQKASSRLFGKYTEISNQKWIVVTSIFEPSTQIEKLSKIPGWQLLVVADKKSPEDWYNPNTIFLDIQTQQSLNYSVLKILPWNSYTRKVVGYLYAIQHGAEYIYDTDDDNAPNDPEIFENEFVFNNTTSGLVYANDSSNIVNPYFHFGQRTIWPRGFPHEYIGQHYNNTYYACLMTTPMIQQGLGKTDEYLGTDAILHLKRNQYDSKLIEFDSSAPPLILRKSVLAPFNSRNTFFHYEAFWALLLPVSVPPYVSDILRAYWSQPLLWRTASHLGFYPSNSKRVSNALINASGDFESYKQTGALIHWLVQWRCATEDLFTCMVELTSKMVNQGFWSPIEIRLVKAWIYDLTSIGYKKPDFRDSDNPFSPCLKGGNKAIVIFNGVEMQPVPHQLTLDNHRISLRKFCNFEFELQSTTTSTKNYDRQQKSVIFPSTLLIVTFNYPHYENIWLLDLIYRSHFPNILYCGDLRKSSYLDKLLTTKEFVDSGVKRFTFVNANVTRGFFGYECAITAVEMKYSEDGYLVLSDDILLNFWNLGKFSMSEMWITNGTIQPLSLDRETEFSLQWGWWRINIGRNATEKALNQIYSEDAGMNVKKFRFQRDSFGYNSTTAAFISSDLFYLPKSKQDIFHDVARILRKSEVFLEIAVPTLLSGLSAPEKILFLPSQRRWYDRLNVFNFFNTKLVFIHPVKYGLLFNNSNLKFEFCDKYIVHVLMQ